MRGLEERGFATFYARGGVMPREQAEYFRQFALIVSYLYDPDGIFEENVRASSGAQFLAGPARVDQAELVHAVDCLLKPLERIAIFDEAAQPRLSIASSSLAPGRWIALHLGSGSEHRVWLERRWVETMQWIIRETDCRILLLGGEAERERLARLLSTVPPDRARVLRGASWSELAPQLAACAAYMGHDTGATQLAAALGLPGVVLWADRVEKVWVPRSTALRVVRSPAGVLGISTEQVTTTLAEVLGAGKSAFDKPPPAPA